MRRIPHVEVAWRKFMIKIHGIEYGPCISTISMKVKCRSVTENGSSHPRCEEGNFGVSVESVNVNGDLG